MINELGDNTFIISDLNEGWQEAIVFKDGTRIASYTDEDRRKRVRQIFKEKKTTLIESNDLKNAVHQAWAAIHCPKHLDVYLVVESDI